VRLWLAVPGPPSSVRLIGITDDSVTVEWTAPATDGGRPVTRYVVERRDGGHLPPAAATPAWTHVASLPARTTVCQVRAHTTTILVITPW